MASFSLILLLAAFLAPVTAGPVPRNDRRQFAATYSNTSTAVVSTIAVGAGSNSEVLTSVSPIESQQPVNADTALVVEPIQQTIFTSIMPAITFLDPEGKPLATGDPETILSTSYITPTPGPTTSDSSSLPILSSIAPSSDAQPGMSSVLVPSSTSDSAVLTSSIAAIENVTASETSMQAPMFTYSPEAGSGVAIASPTETTTSDNVAPSSDGMPGFNHPGSASQGAPILTGPANAAPTSNSSTVQSLSQATASANLPSSTGTILPSSSSGISPPTDLPSLLPSDVVNSTTRIFVTKTEYTTVLPSPSSQVPLAPTEAQDTLSAQQTSTGATALPTTSSAAAGLPTTPQHPPPVVIITQYTTVIPSPGSEPTQATEVPGSSNVPEPAPPASLTSSIAAEPPTSIAAAPTPTAPPAAPEPQPALSSKTPTPSPTPPSNEPSPSPPASSAATTQSVAPSAAPPASTTDVSSAPTDTPPAPKPVPSSTSEGPLIITPIAPSQIFTVTVTATEKETIRETTTVTVTA